MNSPLLHLGLSDGTTLAVKAEDLRTGRVRLADLGETAGGGSEGWSDVLEGRAFLVNPRHVVWIAREDCAAIISREPPRQPV